MPEPGDEEHYICELRSICEQLEDASIMEVTRVLTILVRLQQRLGEGDTPQASTEGPQADP